MALLFLSAAPEVEETMPEADENRQLLERILVLSTLGLEAVLREDWEGFEAVVREREGLALPAPSAVPLEVISSIRDMDRRTLSELHRKRSETGSWLKKLRGSSALGATGSARGRAPRGFDITA